MTNIRYVKHTLFFFFYQEFDYLNISGPFDDGGCVARKNGKIQRECDGITGTQGLPYRETFVFGEAKYLYK